MYCTSHIESISGQIRLKITLNFVWKSVKILFDFLNEYAMYLLKLRKILTVQATSTE